MSKKTHRRRRVHAPFRRRTQPGEMPGKVAVDPQSPPPVIRAIGISPDTVTEWNVENVTRLKQELPKFQTLWVNVSGLGDAKTIRRLGDLFHLHALALEDVVNVHQRPKVEEYGETLFIVAHMVSYTDHVETEQISLFLGKNFVLTFQERPGDCLNPVRERLRRGRNKIRERSGGYLAYAILDAVIDGYFPVLGAIGERLDQLDEEITTGPHTVEVARVHELRRELHTLRRTLWPHRDAIQTLLRDGHPLLPGETEVYLRDCYDHTMQLLEVAETYREICADLRDALSASVTNRTNETVKVLTIISTIFIPLGFIAGVYGMNFDPEASRWNMPELEWDYGYPFALGLMGVVAIALLIYIWRRGWFSS
ncbi:MAG: magnesium/cobalt transporter CorA [Planctomycetaceae bacterium]